MAISNSASTVTDGLVFYMDAGNKKSWIGPPVTNLLSNKAFSGDWAFSGASYDAATQRLVTNTSTVSHFCYLDTTLVNGSTYTQSVVAKAAQRSVLQITPSIGLEGYLTNKYVNFDLSSGIMYGNAIDNCRMDPLGDGWYRCSYRDVAYADGAGRFVLAVVPSYLSDRLLAYADTANYGIYLKQPQLEASPFASPFVDGSRTNTECILDLTGNRTITANSLTYNANNTFSFNGSNTFSTVNNGIVYTNGFTFNVWIYPFSLGKGNRGAILHKRDGTTAFEGFSLRFADTTRVSFFIDSGIFLSSSSNSVPLNTWKNICVTLAQSGTGNLRIYIDGQLNESAGVQTNAANLITTLDPIRIGSSDTGFNQNFDGIISAVQIYQRPLSALEVEQNFSALRGRYGI